MNSITSKEDALVLGEAGSNSLSDLVGRPPVAVLVVDLVRRHDLLRGLEDHIRRDLGAVILLGISFFALCSLYDPDCSWMTYVAASFLCRRELDVQPNQLVLSWNDHDASRVCRVDCATHADVS